MAVLTGNIRGGAKQLARYLTDQAENDAPPVVLDIRGLMSSNIELGLMDMVFQSEKAGSDRAFFNFQFNPRPEEAARMTKADALLAASIIEKHLGLENQMRVVVEHQKAGRRHWHMVWPTFDEQKGKQVPDNHWKYKMTEARGEIEETLKLARTQRFNQDHKRVRKELTEIFQQEDALKAARPSGWIICKGAQGKPYVAIHLDKGRSFVIADHVSMPFGPIKDYLKKQKLPTDKDVIKQIRAAQKFKDVREDVQKVEKPRYKITADMLAAARKPAEKFAAPEPEVLLQKTEVGNDNLAKKPFGPIMVPAKETTMDIDQKQDAFAASIETVQEQDRFKRKASLFADTRDEMFKTEEPKTVAPEEDNVIDMEEKLKLLRQRQRERGHQR
jgi:hypothetical protein